MGRQDLTAPVFFVCGTPIDRYGFDCVTLDGRPLPGRPASYLDTNLAEKFPQRGEATHLYYRDGPENWAVYAEYRAIHPSDRTDNRGAYIAVGCWSEAPLAADQAMTALYRIEAIHRDLAAKRHPETDSFGSDFQLRAYAAPASAAPDPGEADRIRLADLFCQAAAGRGTYDGKDGWVVLSAREIEQGLLAQACTPPPPPTRASAEPGLSAPQSWRARLHEVMRDAASESPRTRQALRKLSKLEDEREKAIESLIRIADRASPPRRGNAASARNARRAEATETHSDDWLRFTTRDIVLSALGAVIGIALASAAVFVARFLGL